MLIIHASHRKTSPHSSPLLLLPPLLLLLLSSLKALKVFLLNFSVSLTNIFLPFIFIYSASFIPPVPVPPRIADLLHDDVLFHYCRSIIYLLTYLLSTLNIEMPTKLNPFGEFRCKGSRGGRSQLFFT